MRVPVFDSTTLLHLLESDAPAAHHPRTGLRLADAPARVRQLICSIGEPGDPMLVAAPVLSEVLLHAAEASDGYVKTLHDTRGLRVVPFGIPAAVELASMRREGITGKKRLIAGSNATRAKLKFDPQMVAIARVEGESTIYSDDKDVARLAAGTE